MSDRRACQTNKGHQMIDTHSHIDATEFADDIESTISRAKEAGVEKIFVPGICKADTPHLLQICDKHAGYLYPMIGLHPENITDEDWHEALDTLEDTLAERLKHENDGTQPEHAPVIAIGEIGLDLYWDDTHKEEQIEVLERQIGWAKKYSLPLMLHTRNAHREMMDVLNKHRDDNLSGVFHCFTGTEEEAGEMLSFPGFMLGIGGVLTFKKSSLRETVKNAIPLSRIVLETDSPYMAPVPHRGQRNESAFVKNVADMLAGIFDCDFNEIVHQTSENTIKVFPKASFFTEK